MKLIVGIIALLTLFVLPVSAAQNPKEELSGVKREINAQKQLITKTRKVEAVVSTELRSILQNLARKESELGNLGRDLRSVESNLDKTGLEVQKVTEEPQDNRPQCPTGDKADSGQKTDDWFSCTDVKALLGIELNKDKTDCSKQNNFCNNNL